jgi:hypothetical protein
VQDGRLQNAKRCRGHFKGAEMFPKLNTVLNALAVLGVVYLIVQSVRTLLFFWGA